MKIAMSFRTMLSLAAVTAGCAMSHAKAQQASLNPMRTVDKASLKSFLQRPLFDPARRLPPVLPPAIVAEAPPAPPEPPPTLQLIGVIQGQKQSHGRSHDHLPRDMAVVHRDGGETTTILQTGDDVNGWKVIVLAPAGMRLRKGRQSIDFEMFGKTTEVADTAAPDGFTDKTMNMSDAMAARTARLQNRTY